MSVVKNILGTKIHILGKLNKIECSYTSLNKIMLLSNCSVCDKKKSTFVKNKCFFNNFISFLNKETGNLKHLYRNKLDTACFTHDAAYSDSKDLAKKPFHIRF